MKTTHLCMRHGSDVLSVESIGHSTYKKVAEWFYVCTVKWSDTGKTSYDVHVTPHGLCHDDTPEGKAEWGELADKLNAYLAHNGKWHDGKWVGEYLVHWTPKKPQGSESIVVEKEVA